MSKNNDPWLRKRQIFSSPVLKERKKKNLLSMVLPILWLAFKKTSMVIGSAVIISTVLSAWFVFSLLQEGDMSSAELVRFPDQMVLYLDIEGDLPDQVSETDFSTPFKASSGTLKNTLDALERGARDPRVKGLYATLSGGHLSVAHAQEFRKALSAFKAAGKFSYIYAPSFDEGLGGYYFARGFDEIWMQPMGVVMISGISAQIPYARQVLDKIGVQPQIYKRKEYKGAYDSFTETDMPEASREAMSALVDDIASVLAADISMDLSITPESFKALVDKGLYMDDEALDVGLVDVLGYEDVLIDHINTRVTGDPEGEGLAYVEFENYISEPQKGHKNITAPKIALVYAHGMIVDQGDTFKKGGIIAAADLAPVLLEIADDDYYDALVLRVDSPGGSPVASETILRAVQKVQESGKSVTVSMGGTAASGGYWIASSADQIFALPATMTGSIGVLGGKFSLAGLWEKLGVNWGEVRWGENASMWSMNAPYSESESERVNMMMDHVYSNFVTRVAQGRHMDEEAVDSIARGRVWSGKRALDVGLVDQLGGLNDALDYAAKAGGAMDRFGAQVDIVPRPLTPIEQIVKFLEEQVSAGEALHIQAGLLHSLLPDIREVLSMSDMLSRQASIYEPVSLSSQ